MNTLIRITCYGPRGSLPAPSQRGFSTLGYGGNTSCYYVEAGPFRIILDNGSGVANLGDDLMKNLLIPQQKETGKMGMPFLVFLSHYHWDHIQGGPFCVPYYLPGNVFHIHGHDPSGFEAGKEGHPGCEPKTAVERMLSEQQSNPHFPVAHECLPAGRHYVGHPRQFSQTFWYTLEEGYLTAPSPSYQRHVLCPTTDPARVLKVTTIPLNHPDGCLGYRIEYMGAVAVYCTDNEPLRHPNSQISRLAKDANWLLLDGQYTEGMLGSTAQSFGHGTPAACVEQAKVCKVQRLVIHHHDPKHDDDTLAAMEAEVVTYAENVGFTGIVEFAREGTYWQIGE